MNENRLTEEEEELQNLIFFRMQREWFALRVEEIREVVQRAQITRVPNAPAFLLGISNLRGRILGIFNLEFFLNLPSPKEREAPHVIILSIPDRESDFGFLVDQVVQIREVSVGRLNELSPPTLGEGRAAFFRGALYHAGQVINVLNPSPIISSLVPELEETSG
jgi:purine-binding chemotaxis protein CheW